MIRAAVAGMGAVTPLGLTAVQTAFMLRTGMPGFGPAPLVDGNGEQVTFGLQPTLDPEVVGLERAALLAAPAMFEAFLPVREFAERLRVGVLLALDEGLAIRDTWGASNPAADLLRAVQDRARAIVPNVKVTPCARGAAGPAFMLPDALAALESGAIDALLFGGVHTDYDPTSIRLLEDQGRLFKPDNLDAVIPGECAAFVLLVRPDVASRAGIELWARIDSIAGGFEKANPDNDESAFEAKGLTTAVKAATKDLVADKRTAGWQLTDLTFEMWRLQEWQAMLTRTRQVWGEPHLIENPAQRMGRLGAAALPLLLGVAAEGWRREWAPAPIAVAIAGSDSGERAALVVSNPRA